MSIRNAQIARYKEYQLAVSRGFSIRTEQAYIDGVLQQWLVTDDYLQNLAYSSQFNPFPISCLPLGAFYGNVSGLNDLFSADSFAHVLFQIDPDNVLAPYTNFYALEGTNASITGGGTNSNISEYIQVNRKSYNPKILPFQAQGTPTRNGNKYSSVEYTTVDYLNITLPYPQASILRGNITDRYTSGNNTFDWFSEKVQIGYPEYSAIEILGLVTNSRNQSTTTGPTALAYETLGGEWVKKTLLFTWRAKSILETPFPNAFPGEEASVNYWIPEGILPSWPDSVAYQLNGNFDSYCKYDYSTYDLTETNSAFQSLYQSPLRQPPHDPTTFNNYGLINPFEIVLDDVNKTFTLNLRIHFKSLYTDVPAGFEANFTGCRFKGIAKLI